jgi:hypothetical protein
MSEEDKDQAEGAPFVKNASDPQQVKAGKKKEKSRHWQDMQDIKAIAETPEGRRFFHRYISKICKVFKTVYQGDAGIYFNEGKRVVGTTMLLDLRNAAPDALLEILTQGDKLFDQK